MKFCNDFDAHLAQVGPAAVFLPDRDGLWRFDAEWTRDAWGRHPGPHSVRPVWCLLRDHDTGFVLLVLVTSPTLLPDHTRMDVRAYDSLDAARAARAELGRVPVSRVPW
jgi:hypothetical protein